MTAQELKAAFVEKFIAEWEAKMETASDRVRRTHTKPHPDGAWEAHMRAVVTGDVEEAPAEGGVEPEYSDVLRFTPRGWGSIQPQDEGIRVSKAVAAGRPQSHKEAREAERQFWIAVMAGGVSATEARGEAAEWVVVELPTGPAVVTIEEAYSLGGRELQVWPS